MGKYDSLENYLANCGKEEVSLTFAEIKQLLGFSLPASAFKYSAWWSNIGENPTSHSHAYSWHNAGYKAKANRFEGKVTFYKETAAAQTIPKISPSRPALLEKAKDH